MGMTKDSQKLSDDKYRAKFNELVIACKELSADRSSDVIRCLAIYKLGVHLETIFAEERDEERLYKRVSEEIDHKVAFVRASSKLNDMKDQNINHDHHKITDIEYQTQELYGNLWVDFSKQDYFEDALKRLKTRLERNDFDMGWFKGKTALDDGCGGGRYTVALANLGFSEVTGLDLSEKGIPDAMNRVKNTPLEKKLKFVQGNVLNLPFKDNTFDFVFSNGVLHHTIDPNQGLKECFRVLKPGGKMWLYMWWDDGIINVYWDSSREILREVNPLIMKSILMVLGLSPGRRFYFMDTWFVPIVKRYDIKGLSTTLQDIGFANVKHLVRGYDDDDNEKSFQLGHIGKIIHGVGDIRLLVEKPAKKSETR